MPDSKQILEEIRLALERYPSHSSLEDTDKFFAELKAEIKAITERHGVPFQDWGGWDHLKKQAAELGKESFEDLKKRAAEINKPKP